MSAKTELEFSLDTGDLIAFFEHQKRTYPIKIAATLFWFLYIAALIATITVFSDAELPALCLIFILYLWVFVIYQRFYVRAYVKAYYATENVTGLVGRRKFTLLLDGFTEQSEFKETRCRWNPAMKVTMTDKHIFIYINRVQAFIIPAHTFASSVDFYTFGGELKMRAEGVATPK